MYGPNIGLRSLCRPLAATRMAGSDLKRSFPQAMGASTDVRCWDARRYNRDRQAQVWVKLSVWARWRSRKACSCSIPNNPSNYWGAYQHLQRSKAKPSPPTTLPLRIHDAHVPLTTAAFSLLLSPWHKTSALSPPMCAMLTPGNATLACATCQRGFVSLGGAAGGVTLSREEDTHG